MGKKTPIFGNRIYESMFVKLVNITSIQPYKTRYEPTLSTQSSALLVKNVTQKNGAIVTLAHLDSKVSSNSKVLMAGSSVKWQPCVKWR